MRAIQNIKIAVPGIHHWPDAATASTSYFLNAIHRHLFHITVKFNITDHKEFNSRAVEFFQYQNIIRRVVSDMFPADISGCYDFGTRSCAGIAADLLNRLSVLLAGDDLHSVEVSEDGECSEEVFVV